MIEPQNVNDSVSMPVLEEVDHDLPVNNEEVIDTYFDQVEI